MYQNIVLHIPHSSTVVPEYLEKQHRDAVRPLRENSFNLVDYYTDSLFLPDKSLLCIHSIVAPYLRTLVDMERMTDEPLEAQGFGIVSKLALDLYGEAFRKQALCWYKEYHRSAMIKLNALKKPLLIDCHSFSALPTPLCECPPNIEICIGWNEDETRPTQTVLDLVISYFANLGYSVGLNEPFSNSKTFPGATNYHSLMIEMNKRCYMNEESLEKTNGFIKLHTDLQDLYRLLLK